MVRRRKNGCYFEDIFKIIFFYEISVFWFCPIANRIAVTEVENKSDFEIPPSTPHLSHTGGLWDLYHGHFGENWLCFSKTWLIVFCEQCSLAVFAIDYSYLALIGELCSICKSVKLPWIFPRAPLKINGAPGNIQGNLTGMYLVWIFWRNWQQTPFIPCHERWAMWAMSLVSILDKLPCCKETGEHSIGVVVPKCANDDECF